MTRKQYLEKLKELHDTRSCIAAEMSNLKQQADNLTVPICRVDMGGAGNTAFAQIQEDGRVVLHYMAGSAIVGINPEYALFFRNALLEFFPLTIEEAGRALAEANDRKESESDDIPI